MTHSGDDDVDPSLSIIHSYASPLSPVQEESAYIPSHDLFLPQASAPSSVVTSPVLSAPIVAPQPSHFGEERRRRSRRAKKPLTIIPPPLPEEPELVAYSAHRVLDGSTLLELEASPPPATELPDLSPDHLDVARTLVRPLSTPPSLHPQRPQVAKVCLASPPTVGVLYSHTYSSCSLRRCPEIRVASALFMFTLILMRYPCTAPPMHPAAQSTHHPADHITFIRLIFARIPTSVSFGFFGMHRIESTRNGAVVNLCNLIDVRPSCTGCCHPSTRLWRGNCIITVEHYPSQSYQ